MSADVILRKPLLVSLLAGLGASSACAQEITMTPPASGSVVIRDSVVQSELFRVDDSGEVFIPGLPTTAQNASAVCFDGSGQLTRCVPAQAGPQGPQGDTGAQGPQGIPGDIGLQGPQGAQGELGPQGAQGIAGATGATGTTGATGVAGATGAQGIQGIQGATGAQGTPGVQGAQGIAGAQGLPGVQGPQGFVGSQGLQGVQGAQGPQGSQGVGSQGPQGPQGTNAGLTRITQGCVGANGSIMQAGSGGWTSTCTGDCSTVITNSNTLYTVTFGTAFSQIPNVMVTSLNPELFTDGFRYPSLAVVTNRTTGTFNVRMASTGGDVNTSYVNAFCFMAIQ